MKIENGISPLSLTSAVTKTFELAARKIVSIDSAWDSSQGTPVFTKAGRYTSRGWTEWTQGFQYGCAILQYDATGDAEFLRLGASIHLGTYGPACHPYRCA